MKTKTMTKERRQERQEIITMKNLQKDLAREFTDVLDDCFLDELAMSEVEDDWYD